MMKKYAVMSIYCLQRRGKEPFSHPPVDVDLHGTFEELDDALKCYHENEGNLIINCENGVLVEVDDPGTVMLDG